MNTTQLKFSVQKTNIATKPRIFRNDINISYQLYRIQSERKGQLCDANFRDFQGTVTTARVQRCFVLSLITESYRFQNNLLKNGDLTDSTVVARTATDVDDISAHRPLTVYSPRTSKTKCPLRRQTTTSPCSPSFSG